MANFFRDRINSADKLIGMYDGAKKQYVLSMNNNVLVDESGNSSVDSRNVIIEKEIKNIQGIFKIYDEIADNFKNKFI